jgi:hypothetical protein
MDQQYNSEAKIEQQCCVELSSNTQPLRRLAKMSKDWSTYTRSQLYTGPAQSILPRLGYLDVPNASGSRSILDLHGLDHIRELLAKRKLAQIVNGGGRDVCQGRLRKKGQMRRDDDVGIRQQ